jgi:hypothetical protein
MATWLVVGAALATSSCSMIGTVDHFEPVLSQARGADVRVRRYMTGQWLWFCVGGDGIGFEVTRSDGKLLVSSPSYSWDQDLMGPILPILPVPMGAGSYRPTIELRIEAIDGGSRLLWRDALTICADGSHQDIAPSSWVRDGEPIAEAFIELSEGDEVLLSYPAHNRTTSRFQLRLPRDRGDATVDVFVLPFEQARSRFFAFSVL